MANIQQQMVKLLCKNEFYTANKDIIPVAALGDDIKDIVKTLRSAHETYKRDIEVDELMHLHFSRKVGLTTAQKDSLAVLFNGIKSQGVIGDDVAKDLMRDNWRVAVGNSIANYGVDLAEGRRGDISNLVTYLGKVSDDFTPDKFVEPVTTNIDELLDQLESKPRWRFNLKPLAQKIPGIAGGELMIVFARPEVGKSLVCIDLTAGPGGFVEQGAKVTYVVNEEPAVRTMLRCVNSFTGYTADEIAADRKKALPFQQTAKDKLFILDDVTMTIGDVERYVDKHKPDVLILDQADKVSLEGSFESDTAKLRQLYIRIRQIAKVHNCAVIAVSQASADADGKVKLSYSMLENSKTGKAAEADIILGAGTFPGTGFEEGDEEDNRRVLTICKNKITGVHPSIPYRINPKLSRMEE